MIPTTCKYCGGPIGFHECTQVPLCTVCKKVPASDPWPHDPRTATREKVIAVDWGSGEPATVYGAMRDGKLVYCTPEREEFSQWLERDGLNEGK